MKLPTPEQRAGQPRRTYGVYALPHLVWAGSVLGNGASDTNHEKWVRGNLRTIVRMGLTIPRFDLPVLSAPYALASVLQNCWIAQCPWCRGQEGIWAPDDWFYCLSCGNEATQGQRVTVGFTAEPEEVAAVLERRPVAMQRGWLPTESTQDLLAENAANGVPDPARRRGATSTRGAT